jgi:hypothetical protein
MTLSERWLRILLLAMSGALLAFLVAQLIVMSQNGHQGTNALFVYGP